MKNIDKIIEIVNKLNQEDIRKIKTGEINYDEFVEMLITGGDINA